MNFPATLLISPFIGIMKCLCAPVVQRIVFVKDLKRNFEMLNEKGRSLFSKRDDIKDEITRHGIGKVVTRECENWLNKVEEIEHQVNEIEEEYNREDGRCLRRQCLNIQSQWKLSKRVVVTMNHISDLIEESKNFARVVVDALPQVAEIIPTPTINIEISTNRTLSKILECVRNPEKHKIGIWGMGGIGKTTVMKNLNNLAELEQIFKIVIWVTVSKDCNIRKIQNEIANRLQLGFSNNESDERVARKLYEHLKTNKFLLLMDDVWNKVDLDDVGVPCPNQNGSKVVLTTRYRQVCNKMDTDEEIKVEPLPSEEAWKLFREKAGEVVDLPSIHLVATSVVAECAGLPLAINVIGASLRKEDSIHVWNNALEELSSPATSNMEDMEEQVFMRLRFSFDRLKDDNLRNCFLYAALFAEHSSIPIDEIIDYWIVEGFISSSLNFIKKRSMGYAILKELIDASLLERVNYMFFKMHDVIRDLALKITSAKRKGCKFFVRAGTMIREHPENKEWEQVERISLMKTELSKLPERPCCPTLLTLLLQENKKLITIPGSFFEDMRSLRVLDLSNTNIESLPPSICNLVSLRGLYLKYCSCLETLPPEIGALASLEVLDVRHSGMSNLPSEIGELAHLRVLQLTLPSFCEYGSVMMASGTIARLSLLEQLSTIGVIMRFRLGLPCAPECAEALIGDICCLEKLTSLSFFFPEVEYLEYFLQRSSSWREGSIVAFSFIVGMHVMHAQRNEPIAVSLPQENDRWDKSLTLCSGESIPNAIVEVLGYANSFTLGGHRSIRKLCELGVGNMNCLRHCLIDNCIGMKIVFDGARITDIALPNLETLNIFRLPNLKSVWNDPLPLGSLACLKELNLSYCHNLKMIFSRETIQQLSNLEKLIVQHCSSLKQVIHEEAACMMFDCNLPKLRRLCVSGLPALVCILNGCCLSCPSLEEIQVHYCPKLKRLPQGIDRASNLKKIRCAGEWWNELEWDDNAIKLQLQLLVSREYDNAFKGMVFA